MKTKTIAKNLKSDVTDLIVDLEDIVYSFPKEMSIQEKQYFDMYVGNIKGAIRDLDIELDMYKETGFNGDDLQEEEDGGT